jgi:hypothetical protein
MLPDTAVTVMVRTLRSAPIPTLAVSWPVVSVLVAPGVMIALLSAVITTGTPANELRLASMAVAVATTDSAPLLATFGALNTNTRSAAVGVLLLLVPSPPPRTGLPASPPPPQPLRATASVIRPAATQRVHTLFITIPQKIRPSTDPCRVRDTHQRTAERSLTIFGVMKIRSSVRVDVRCLFLNKLPT